MAKKTKKLNIQLDMDNQDNQLRDEEQHLNKQQFGGEFGIRRGKNLILEEEGAPYGDVIVSNYGPIRNDESIDNINVWNKVYIVSEHSIAAVAVPPHIIFRAIHNFSVKDLPRSWGFVNNSVHGFLEIDNINIWNKVYAIFRAIHNFSVKDLPRSWGFVNNSVHGFLEKDQDIVLKKWKGEEKKNCSLFFPSFDRGLTNDPTTRPLFDAFGAAHDFEAHEGISSSALRQKLFSSHFGHLAVLFLWTAGNLFHVSWQGNFQQWAVNPLSVAPIAHAIWDPHFGAQGIDAYTAEGFTYPANGALSGLYEWWYTIGIRTDMDLYFGALGLLASAALVLFAGWFHLTPSYRPSLQCLTESASELGHHIGTLVGLSSLAWAGHLIHVALPESRGEHVRWYNFLSRPPHPDGLTPLFTRHWETYSQNPDGPGHILGTSEGAGTAILTFLGGFNPQTGAMWLTDIAHHHLALAVFLIFTGHLFETVWKVSPLKLDDSNLPYNESSSPERLSLQTMVTDSLQLRLALTLLSCGVGTSLVAQHMLALPAYVFLAPLTTVSLYVHHQFIAGIFMLGAFAHGAIFLVRDYNPISPDSDNRCISYLLRNKESSISILSWVSLFLGFHTLGIYVHNDACVAFGEPEKQILIEPVFAQIIQTASSKTAYLAPNNSSPIPLGVRRVGCYFKSLYGTDLWLPGWSEAVNSPTNSLFLTIGPGDLLVHHAIALGLHTTTLILYKGALDARGSKLMPDKKDFGYAFPCDGPGRGGTCDISAWDAFYLAAFWMLNTTSWTIFYVHWATFSATAFATNSTYLMGWFSAYLWSYSAEVISGYGAWGTGGGNGVWTWTFNFAHLTWATGFMFLISWRGYWQELIETLVWAHQRTPIANQIDWVHKPVALSIVQARLVGLWHFAVGFTTTFAAFLLTTSPSSL